MQLLDVYQCALSANYTTMVIIYTGEMDKHRYRREDQHTILDEGWLLY